jgi:hypothetical protein
LPVTGFSCNHRVREVESSEMANLSEPVRNGGCRNRDFVAEVQDGSGQTAAADTAFPCVLVVVY